MRIKYLHDGDIALTFGEGAIVSPRSKRSKRLRIDLHASGEGEGEGEIPD